MNSLFADLAKDAPKPVKTAFVKCLEQGYAKIVKAAPQGERANTRQKLAMRLHDEEGLDVKRCAEALAILEAALFGSAEEGVFVEAQPKAAEAKPAPNANPLVGTWFAENYTDYQYYLYIEKPDTATLDADTYFDSDGFLLTARYGLTVSVSGSKVTLSRKSGWNILRGKGLGKLKDNQLSDFSLELNANGTELKGISQGGMQRDWIFTKVATREKTKILIPAEIFADLIAKFEAAADAPALKGGLVGTWIEEIKDITLWIHEDGTGKMRDETDYSKFVVTVKGAQAQLKEDTGDVYILMVSPDCATLDGYVKRGYDENNIFDRIFFKVEGVEAKIITVMGLKAYRKFFSRLFGKK